MTNLLAADPITLLSYPQLKSWTVKEYRRLSELGILESAERTELIAGQIILMVAKGTPHVVTLQLLSSHLAEQLGAEQLSRSTLIRTQDPIHLDNSSEPEPDLVIVNGGILDYVDRHPQPADIHLVVEVADFTLKYDCEVKNQLYAQANIPEYWVVDVKNRQVHIFRDPTPTGYTSQLIVSEPQSVSTLAFAGIVLSIAAILPPL